MLSLLFNSKVEDVSPPQLARALGFSVYEFSDDLDDTLEELYRINPEIFYSIWKPTGPDGFILAGAYETEDGPYAFFVKPDNVVSFELFRHFVIHPTPVQEA